MILYFLVTATLQLLTVTSLFPSLADVKHTLAQVSHLEFNSEEPKSKLREKNEVGSI